MALSEKKAIFSEINITPLTDIFLVLLIIMMVIAPSFQSVDKSIDVPEINSGVAIEQKEAVVSITADGTYYLNNKLISPSKLFSELEALKPSLTKKEIVVKADATVKSSLIMEVMRAAEDAKYEKLTIAGEPLNKKQSQELQQTSDNTAASQPTAETTTEPPAENTQQKLPMGELPGD